jgi:hypothetical protein
MHLINNQPIVDLSSYVNVQTLSELKPSLDYAVVKSSGSAKPGGLFSYMRLDQKGLGVYDISESEVDKSLPFIQDLIDNDQLVSWLRYQKDIVYAQQTVQIIYAPDYATKHIKDKCIESKHASYFDSLFDWIKQENVFKEFGRVVVFLNEPGVPTHIHFDEPHRKNEFIWISLSNRKKFFIYDTETQTKHYLDGLVGIFDTSNYHGADAGDYASWSIRIDGVFTDDFLNRTGMYEYFRT